MSDPTDRARKLLEAASDDAHCGDGKMIGSNCAGCTAELARHKLTANARATLAAAITAIEALLCAPCEETGLYTSRCKSETYCLRCGALAEWERLFPETQRPANGGVDEARADQR